MKRAVCFVCLLDSGLRPTALAQKGTGKPSSANVSIIGSTKIAVINFQQAVTQTNGFQRKMANLPKVYAPREQEARKAN